MALERVLRAQKRTDQPAECSGRGGRIRPNGPSIPAADRLGGPATRRKGDVRAARQTARARFGDGTRRDDGDRAAAAIERAIVANGAAMLATARRWSASDADAEDAFQR